MSVYPVPPRSSDTRERSRRDQTVDLLVDEAIQKAIDGGEVLGNEERFRDYKRARILEQAERHPGWLQKQSERFFGEVARPASKPTCPWCELIVSANDGEVVRGMDGLLYCRRACAERAPFVGFAEACGQHPEWAEQLAFVAMVLERKGLGGGRVGLSSITTPAREPAGADLAF